MHLTRCEIALLLATESFVAGLVSAGQNELQIPESIPVGDENFFRAEGAKLVHSIIIDAYENERPEAEPLKNDLGTPWWSWSDGWNNVVGDYYPKGLGFVPTVKPINQSGSWTQAQLLQFGKECLGKIVPRLTNPNALYAIGIWWTDYDGEKDLGMFPFQTTLHFRLERQADGSYRPPRWVVENLSLDTGPAVFMPVKNIWRARLRWFDGTKFYDWSDNTGAILSKQGASIQSNQSGPVGDSVYAGDGLLMLNREPALGKRTGVLTISLGDPNTGKETLVRYNLRTGVKFPGVHEQREPIIVSLRQEPGGARIIPSGDFESTSEIVFERSSDLKNWREIIRGIDGGLIEAGMGVLPSPTEFFRARYR